MNVRLFIGVGLFVTWLLLVVSKITGAEDIISAIKLMLAGLGVYHLKDGTASETTATVRHEVGDVAVETTTVNKQAGRATVPVLASLFVAVLLLASCAQMGLQSPQSFDERLAYSYSAVTATRTSAAAAVQSGTLSVQDAQTVLDDTNQVRTLLDGAKMSESANDTSTALGKLQSATTLLNSITQLLQARGVK